MQKIGYLAGLLHGNCPRCRQGKIFTHGIFERVTNFNRMNEFCPHCELRLQPEPGFYQGAMYVSYAFTVAVLVVIASVLYVTYNPPDSVYISVIVGVMVLLVPLNYRYSRILYLYLFGGINYNPNL